MPSVHVAPVVNWKQRRQFLNFPATLYRDVPQWVPRIRSSESALVGFHRHAFRDRAESVAFLAMRNDEVCGRILAIDNHAHRDCYPHDRLGFVGFYECREDVESSHALFDAATSWLKSRSLVGIRGPVSPSMNYEAGLLISGFEKAPTFLMPYGMPYYPSFWAEYGFQKVQDLFAFRADEDMLVKMNEKVRKIGVAAEERFGAKFRKIDPKTFQQDVQTFLELYNAASASTWGFVPLLSGEIRQLSGELKHLIIPELTTFLTIDGKIVGAAFGMLDYNPIVAKIRGRLFPFGFLSILRQRKAIRKTRIMSINILPEFQRWGLGLSLMGYLFRQGISWGLDEVEFSYVLESNHLAKSTLTNGGAVCDKTYRIYEKKFD